MQPVGIVVEGLIDRVAVERILDERGLVVDPHRIVVTRGKSTFDKRVAKYNQAAVHGAWLALRDADHDGDGCPVNLRRALLTTPQSPGFCLRLAVRTLEAWLLGDIEAFATHFSVPRARIPAEPESLARPKDALVAASRASKRRDVREAMAPPAGMAGTGPEYTAYLSRYCREAWRPEVAAPAAPSLRRAIAEIDRLVQAGIW